MKLSERIKRLPLTSGVYLMKNGKGKIIYVGKAISLRKRVGSYFRSKKTSSKTDMLVEDVRSVDYVETNSEAEALILEANLIKEHNPKYNVFLKDDKSYPYIEITDEDYPRISIERPKIKKKGATYYGPYVNVGSIREALKVIRKIFYFRTGEKLKEREKLDYQMGLCKAPSVEQIDKKEYNENIRKVRLILEGKKDVLYRRLRNEMEKLTRRQKFEEAAVVRDQLRAIGAVYAGTKDVNYYKEAEQLQRALNLPRLPERIEAFDVSNIMGNQAVGSMVSFFNGKPDKSNYRKFKIKEVKGIDDFKMIAEIVKRRYRRLKNEGAIFPDLIVIDGGKGQLSCAYRQLDELEVSIPIIALAKREEEVFMPKKGSPIILSADSLGLKLLQRLRDEAHRFAINYHRKLRSKNVFNKEKE